ncbi:hypothetical protein JCM8202_001114 [Rhodotorula sphaerocarpa]
MTNSYMPRLLFCLFLVAAALAAPLTALPDACTSLDSTCDLDTFFSGGLNSEDPGSVQLINDFPAELSNVIGSGIGDSVSEALADSAVRGVPHLPPTRVTISFGVSVDVGELPAQPNADLGSAFFHDGSSRLAAAPTATQAAVTDIPSSLSV